MKWYVNGLTNLLNTHLNLSDGQLILVRNRLDKLFSHTLSSAIQERSFPITPACMLFKLLEHRLIFLRNTSTTPQKRVSTDVIYEYIIGCMIIVLKIDCDCSYYVKDFIKPINEAFGTNTTLATLKRIETNTLKLIINLIAPIDSASLVSVTLKYCKDTDIIQFWHELNSPDYHDTHEYIQATLPRIKQIYRDQLHSSLSGFLTIDADPAQSQKSIFNYITNLCGSLKLDREYTLILEILNEKTFDRLRSKQPLYQPLLFAASYPTLWENITSIIKEKAAIKSAAHIFAGYQRCMANPITGL